MQDTLGHLESSLKIEEWDELRTERGTWFLVYVDCLSCTEEEKAEARAFEEDQVAGRLKEDVVRMESGWKRGRLVLHPGPVLSLLLSSPCSLSRGAGCRRQWRRR